MLAALVLAPGVGAEDIYRRAEAGADGRVLIVTADGRKVVADRRGDQVGVDKIAVAPDGRSVGWLPLYPNCCTSYPIPHELVIFASGRERELRGNGLPVWQWAFLAGGAQVAFRQETVHGGMGIRYELREVATGALLGEYEPGTSGDAPAWVRDLDGDR